MPGWLVFCLISQFFWALVYILDAYCVNHLFHRSWFGGVVSALSMAMLLPITGIAAWTVEPQTVSLAAVSLAFFGGAMHMIGQFCYFRALVSSESGIISAYFNMSPLLVPVAAWMILGEVLGWLNYLVILIIVLCSISFCLLDSNRRGRWQSFGLMFVASVLEAHYLLSLKMSFDYGTMGPVFLASTGGMMLVGWLPLIAKSNRQVFISQWSQLRVVLGLVVGIELINLIAIYFAQRGLELGSPSKVAAVEASTPASCFLISWLLWRVLGRIGEAQSSQRLAWKLTLTVVMAFCIAVLARSS